MKTPHFNLPKSWPVLLATTAACAGITFAAWSLAVSPALQQRELRAHRLVELSSLRRKAASLSNQLTSAHHRYAAAADNVAKMALHLDPVGLVNTRLAQLTRLANDCGLEIDETQPGQVAAAPHYQVVDLKIAGSGTYPAATRFLHRLRERFRDVAVRSMDLSADSGNALSPGVRMRLELVWYAAPAGSGTATPNTVAENQ